MTANIGHLDRIIRALIGAVLAGFVAFVYYEVIAFTLSTVLSVVVLVIAADLLLTAIFGWSPLYALFRIDTYKAEEGFCPITHPTRM